MTPSCAAPAWCPGAHPGRGPAPARSFAVENVAEQPLVHRDGMHAQRAQQRGGIVIHLLPHTLRDGDERRAKIRVMPRHQPLRGLIKQIKSPARALGHADRSLDDEPVHRRLLVVTPDRLAQLVQVIEHAPLLGHDGLLLGAQGRQRGIFCWRATLASKKSPAVINSTSRTRRKVVMVSNNAPGSSRRRLRLGQRRAPPALFPETQSHRESGIRLRH
jgi:hypothetical protein